MTVREQSDGLIPNKQTPPSTKSLGTSADQWDEVYATNLYRSGVAVSRYFSVSADLGVAGVAVTHNLNNSNPVIQVYGSGTNELYGMGSGIATVIVAASGSSANAVTITMSAAAPGSTVVIIG